MSKRKIKARITVNGWAKMDRAEHRDIVRWLRKCAKALEDFPQEYSNRTAFRLVDVRFGT